ncbi:MAG: STAS domain-containing protein [Rhodocyclaceae bacterium]|nr:STAS domain-containing protein [Rhodocyclaceae bacterium]
MIERDGKTLRVSGPITMTSAPAVRDRGLVLLGKDVATVDLSAVTEVDSAAIAVVLAWRRQAGRALAFVGIPAALGSLASLYGLERLLDEAA